MNCLKARPIVLVFACVSILTLPPTAVRKADAQIKYVYSLDYPLAQKDSYLAWVESIASTLQAPEEIRGIVAYDNVFGVSPHRFIEFQFEDMKRAAAYFERSEINQVLEHVVNYGENGGLVVLERRSDYETVPGSDRGAIKYLLTLDYPLGMKDSYVRWVASVADSLHAPPEIIRITSYDNYFGSSPHRHIEFEFRDLEAAAQYFQRPSISRVFEDVVDHGVNGTLAVLRLRVDYAAAE
ncbi:MAG TPA: hypothetical protein VMO47_07645 [Rhodothermales bacterium]|nr:hypothetical protein [Rhodothermales bacterium]